MAEIIKETITTQGNGNTPVANAPIENTPVKNPATNFQTTEYLVYFLLGVLEILLVFRLVLKFMGASMSSTFVGLIYGLSGVFISPFEGIFRRWFSPGLETTSVLEPSTIVAIIVYAVLVWGIVKLIRIFSGEKKQAD